LFSVYGADLDNLIRQTNRFVPERGFEGAEREPVPAGGGGGGRGSGPVQFEQAQRGGGDEDLFGLDDLLKVFLRVS
jgi:hypothetical protein